MVTGAYRWEYSAMVSMTLSSVPDRKSARSVFAGSRPLMSDAASTPLVRRLYASRICNRPARVGAEGYDDMI
jgi:hypothetical protein